MKNWESKLTAMEKLLTPSNSNPRDCGKGLQLPKGTPVQWSSLHRSYACWTRENPVEYARAAMILDGLKQANALGIAPSSPAYAALMEVGEPSPELVEECRQSLLSQGCELEEEC